MQFELNKKYGRLYAEKVLKMNDPLYEIEWLFSLLSVEEKESLVEIFNLDHQENE